MKKVQPAASPDAYVAALTGWQRDLVVAMRAAVRAAAPLDEQIKWGNLVYFASGPVLVIRAEAERVLLGFWRGRRLREIEPRLEAGGKYEMATVKLLRGMAVQPAVVRRLVRAAVALDAELGDPTKAAQAKPVRQGTAKTKAKAKAKPAARSTARARRTR